MYMYIYTYIYLNIYIYIYIFLLQILALTLRPDALFARNGASVLHLATEGGYEDLVKMLLQEGANTNRARLIKVS